MTKNHPLIHKRIGLREIARELNEKGVRLLQEAVGGMLGPLNIY